METKKISRTILKVQRNLSLKIHVKLTYDDEHGNEKPFHNEYDYGGNNYLRIDSSPIMTLDLTEKETGWDKSKSIIITPMNTVQIVKSMERLLKAIYSDDIFAVDKKDKLIIYKDMAIEHTERVFNLGMNQRLVMKPAIIYDHNDVEIEGVVMFLNKADNIVELSIDAFEGLMYVIKKVDLFTYSQLLLNYFIAYESNKDNIKPDTKKQRLPAKRNVFENKESVQMTGNFKRNTDSFDGLGKQDSGGRLL